ncbi:MAG: creatininase family protein [Deltaproteobacteria bacterium]|nr:creatininase family protein [Deltaproteobacteria bacterium]
MKTREMMGVYKLENMTWPEIRSEIDMGRDTVVVCFGSNEQHGRHLPTGTDAIVADRIGLGLAERLGAFLAPTYRVGCSRHHMAFAGTITLEEETFKQVVIDTVRSLLHHGFKKIVLVPTHGGNFKPLGDAMEQLEVEEDAKVIAYTDLDGLMENAFEQASAKGITEGQAGIHSGEWETSLMLEIAPELVKMNEAVAGNLDELAEIKEKLHQGTHLVDENGVIGDPRLATAEKGRDYLEATIDLICRKIKESF